MSKNLSLLADFYEFTMSNGFFAKNMTNKIAYFDVFFRKVPDNGGYVVFAGLEQVIGYINDLKFDDEDIEFLRNTNKFSKEFLEYLSNFKFTGDIWAVPEGTVVFPNEPLITVRAPIIEAQILETMILLLFNHQSLIATKASRIVASAKGRSVLDFGARRAHSIDAAFLGARAAMIGGVSGTSCTLTAQKFNVPAIGTMAHSFIQSFDSEYEAFKAYAEVYPDNCLLLIDTYDTLNSGIVNAIKVFNEIVVPKGFRPKGVRLDSGDLAYLSKQVRQILDDAGFPDCKICLTNSLDEFLITSLLEQGAKVDTFGVGENLITAKSDPVFGKRRSKLYCRAKHSDRRRTQDDLTAACPRFSFHVKKPEQTAPAFHMLLFPKALFLFFLLLLLLFVLLLLCLESLVHLVMHSDSPVPATS